HAPGRHRAGISPTLVAALCALLGVALVGGLALALKNNWFDTTSPRDQQPPTLTAPTGPTPPNHLPASTSGTAHHSPTAAPDPTAAAFLAVRADTCLPLYDTGHAADTVTWNTAMPPAPVDCDSGRAMVRVTRVSDSVEDCRTGVGHAYWYYRAAGGPTNTVLCLSRVYRANYCLLARRAGTPDAPTMHLGPMTAVDCTDRRPPAAYNEVLHLTGVHQAGPDTTATACTRAPGDRTRYWVWKVDDGRTLLCATVYRPTR
ncbi:hypothetical protein GL263_27450, partial [Streptomyces durbertensis]